MSDLFQPLRLPNGSVIPNRLAKAAMEENLADAEHAPGPTLIRLYRAWAKGGAGLIITGNVMVDRHALTGPAGVVLEDDEHLPNFRAWAAASRSYGAQAWLQINHPGRQLMANLGQPALGPSAIPVDIPGLSKLFVQPQALDERQIEQIIQRYVTAAVLAERAGFTGVQIHAAHGYLFSQFLSPLSNCRRDGWGGSLENRARILLRTVEAVRAQVAPQFCVAVKLNSADFQRGGFEVGDAEAVVKMLAERAVDLVELSGGSYESPAMQGQTRDGSTLAREAYFLKFAERIGQVAAMPIMVTGGVRRRAVAERIIERGVAMVGMATALAIEPGLPARWRAGDDIAVPPVVVGWKNRALAAAATQAVVKKQLVLLGSGKPSNAQTSPLLALVGSQLRQKLQARRYRRWVASKGC
ncbi:NADH:flavin oxidoreductase/NADH oxidase family protein [Pseudomonas sediminis]|uniref:2,4-dienoyl-CoA reductase n=1 Tax=Pseudomonas sediminis TaxID=1691904 RepID=A0A2G5FK73_9PSED|nr:NADH:flavin oxidoreductase/NADH oxidase family protein [Pseudomonas sediminis]PIA68387.1 2,4-dienoyl-CoA reductase [Pseudomonas sediminis]